MQSLGHTKLALISFDVWKTLIRSNPDFKVSRARLFMEAFGISEDRFKALVQLIREIDSTCDQESDQTGVQLGPEDRLRRVIARLEARVSDQVVRETAGAAQRLLLDSLPEWNEPELLESLDRLVTSGYKLALVSNTGFIDGSTMRRVFKNMGLWPYISHAIFSNEVGVAKPHPEIFGKLVEASSLPASSILHVGDNPIADYQGATDAGLQSVVLSQTALSAVPTIPSIRQLSEELNKKW